MKVLLTGVSGLVGGRVASRILEDQDIELTVVARKRLLENPSYVSVIRIPTLDDQTNWSTSLDQMDVVVHAAARVHVTNDQSADPLCEYRKVNVQGTLNLARQAAQAGVRRFVFVSSIKVNGEATLPDHPFTADDEPAPLDPYGLSKMEAEQGLREISAQTGMEVVIVRPPLVYGPGVKANFASMMRWVASGVPLPLGAIHNARSMVALDNLVDLLVTCLKHPAAVGQTFLVSDGEDVSTTQLLRRTAQAMGKPARLLPVPANLLELGATLLGKRDVAQRLCGSLQVDISKTRQLLGWSPPLTLDQGLKKAVEG
jgi:nucleoside-diphosphate-sugar epimerase